MKALGFACFSTLNFLIAAQVPSSTTFLVAVKTFAHYLCLQSQGASFDSSALTIRFVFLEKL